MKHTCLILLFVLFAGFAKAQKGLDDIYQFNYLSLSPAMTGERGNYGLSIFLGNQFNGTLVPNQVSQVFSIDGVLDTGPHAIGFQGFNNTLGFQRSSGFNLNHSYEIKTQNIEIQIGTDVGATILPNILNTTISQRFKLFGGFGLLTKGEKWWANISSPLLLSDPIAQLQLGGRKFNFMGGYLLGDPEILGAGISGLASLGSANTNNFHLNTKVWIYNRWVAGVSLRNVNASMDNSAGLKIVPSLEYNLNNSSQFGLAFDSSPQDFRLTGFQQANNPSLLYVFYKYAVFPEGKRPLLNLF